MKSKMEVRWLAIVTNTERKNFYDGFKLLALMTVIAVEVVTENEMRNNE